MELRLERDLGNRLRTVLALKWEGEGGCRAAQHTLRREAHFNRYN